MRLLKLLLCVLCLAPAAHADQAPSFVKGETINYTVRKFGVGGKATLTFQGQDKINGRDAYLIVFKADGFNFYDEEKIYLDMKAYTPVSVLRDINIFGKKEKITEDYTGDKLKITKVAGGNTTEETLDKKPQVDNIYGAIYRYRQSGSFKIGDKMELHLPTKDVTLKLLKMDKVTAGGRKYDAYYMQSVPNAYNIWFDTSPKHIPLRITGTAGFGNTNMMITDYKEK
jgi:hypothetical protein